MNLSQTVRENLKWLALIALLILIFFFDPLFTGKVFFFDDISGWFYPVRHFQYDMGRAGKIFLWNPYMFAGQPYFADLQTALLYPVNWLFFFIEPARGLVYYTIIHFLIGCLSMFLFLRRFGRTPAAAVAGAVFYGFSGFAVLHAIHPGLLAGYALIPLGLILADNLRKKQDLTSSLIFGLFLTVHFFAGAAQATMFMMIITGSYLLYHTVLLHRRGQKPLKLIGLGILSLVVMGLLSLIQVLPALEFMSQTSRSAGTTFEFATAGSLRLKDLITLLVPDYYGNPVAGPTFTGDYFYWESNVYGGIFPILLTLPFLFVFALRKKCSLPTEEEKEENKDEMKSADENGILFFTGLILFGILMAFGKNLPFYRIFYALPLVKSFRVPARFLSISWLGTAFIISTALDFLPLWAKDKIRASRMTAVLSALLAVGLGTGFYAVKTGLYGFTLGVIFLFITTFGGSILIFTAVRRKIGEKLFKFGSLAVIAVSCLWFGFTWNPTTDSSFYRQRAGLFAPIARKTPPVRIHYYPPFILKDTINFSGTMGVSNLVGYNPLAVGRYMEYLIYSDYGIMMDEKINREVSSKGNIYGLVYPTAKMIRLLNPKVLYKFDEKRQGFEVSPVPDTYPRTFVVENVIQEKDREKILKTLRSDSFDPERTIIVEEEDPSTDSADDSIPGGARIDSFEPDRIVINVDVKRKSMLFLGEIFYPGWKAYVNGEERKVYRGNYIFRTVQVKPGDTEVIFKFEPDSVKKGTIASAVTFFIIIGYFLLTALGKLKNRSSANSEERKS